MCLAFAALALPLYACSPGTPPAPPPKPAPAAPPPKPAPPSAPPAPADVQAINGAAFTPGNAAPASSQTADAVLIRAEILLDRADFSPGVIDGLAGSNAKKAIGAF